MVDVEDLLGFVNVFFEEINLAITSLYENSASTRFSSAEAKSCCSSKS